MTIYTNQVDKVCTLELHGRLTAAEASQLQGELTKVMRLSDQIILDFANLEYIASAGLRQLMIAQKYMENKNGEVIVRNASDDILEILEDTGFDTVLKIEK